MLLASSIEGQARLRLQKDHGAWLLLQLLRLHHVSSIATTDASWSGSSIAPPSPSVWIPAYHMMVVQQQLDCWEAQHFHHPVPVDTPSLA